MNASECYTITLDLATVVYTVDVEQDDQPVCCQSGDPNYAAEDSAMEDAIRERLDRGDVWAWAVVTVTASAAGFIGRDTVGGFTFDDADAFEADAGAEMRETALDALRSAIVAAGGVLVGSAGGK